MTPGKWFNFRKFQRAGRACRILQTVTWGLERLYTPHASPQPYKELINRKSTLRRCLLSMMRGKWNKVLKGTQDHFADVFGNWCCCLVAGSHRLAQNSKAAASRTRPARTMCHVRIQSVLRSEVREEASGTLNLEHALGSIGSAVSPMDTTQTSYWSKNSASQEGNFPGYPVWILWMPQNLNFLGPHLKFPSTSGASAHCQGGTVCWQGNRNFILIR